MKSCTLCKIEKPFEDFHKRSASDDGRDYRCKECRKKEYPKRGFETSSEINEIEGKRVLRALGYDLDGEVSVYDQFKKRCIDRGVDVSDW